MSKKRKNIIMLLGVLSVMFLTLGITMAFFSYVRQGTSENTIKIGAISFIYTEESNGISIEDALPMSDTDGKAQNKYFDFKIKSNTTIAEIPYSITVRKSEESTLSESLVKLYLTEVSGGSEQELVLSKYSELSDASWINDYNDKVLYEDTVPVNGSEYVKNYRLRMWLSDEANYNTDNISNKTFSLTVNVYTNQGRSLTKDNITTKDDTRIKMVTLNDRYLLEESDEIGVDLEATVPNDVDSGYFTVTENNMLANSTVTEIGNSLSYSGNGLIKKLKSNSNAFSLSTTSNYYKLRVRSADTEKTEDYVLKVTREKSKDNNLTSLAVDGYAFQEPFDKDTTEYHVSLEETSINITGTKSSDIASISGTGTKTLSWGENRFNVTVTPEDPNTQAKVYTIIVNNVRPTAPTIQGGTGEVAAQEETVISVLSPGTAISGIDYYEYYIGTSSTKPADGVTVTGTTQDEVTINQDGNYYIFYRTVSKSGNKSGWTDYEKVVIDKNPLRGLARMVYDDAITNQGQIYTNPRIITSTQVLQESGLYGMEVTNGFGGQTNKGTTYFFRGDVSNNKVKFAGFDWRIVRINEDGTVRLILDGMADYYENNTYYAQAYINSSSFATPNNMYYSTGVQQGNATYPNARFLNETWYSKNISNNANYSSKVATGNYFCESAVVAASNDANTQNGTTQMEYITAYTPTLECKLDQNNHQYVNSYIGLLTYDEVIFAGGSTAAGNTEYYLYKISNANLRALDWWLMSPAGMTKTTIEAANYTYYSASQWLVSNSLGIVDGSIFHNIVTKANFVRPVINLKANTMATKDSNGVYIIQ